MYGGIILHVHSATGPMKDSSVGDITRYSFGLCGHFIALLTPVEVVVVTPAS